MNDHAKNNSYNIKGNVGVISNGDNANIKDVNVNNTNNQSQNDEISLAFTSIYNQVNKLENEEKHDAQNAVTALEKEARKGELANEKQIKKWLNFLLDTAPDVWDVAVDTLLNPINGIHTVFRKIAQKAKESRRSHL